MGGSPLDTQNFSAAVYRIDAGGGAAEILGDVSRRLGGRARAFEASRVDLDGAYAVSPQGRNPAVPTFSRSVLGNEPAAKLSCGSGQTDSSAVSHACDGTVVICGDPLQSKAPQA